DTVRVDIRKLDDLMNLVGELVIVRGSLGDLIARMNGETALQGGRQSRPTRSEPQASEGGPLHKLGSEFVKVHKVLDRKLRELQSAVLEVRMVPLRQVFEKVSRVVR